MSDETDYEALEKSVKYIPWKGKKTEWYTWHKTFLVRAMIRGYHGVLVGLEAIPSDDMAKKLAILSDLTEPANYTEATVLFVLILRSSICTHAERSKKQQTNEG